MIVNQSERVKVRYWKNCSGFGMETCSPLAIDVKISDGYYTVRWKVKNFSDNSLPCEYTC